MSNDWIADVKKYAPNLDEAAVKGIIKHCGIALHSRDGSFVSCSDKAERDKVRDSFLKKKLALTESDDQLDKAVMDICQSMKADHNKARVTFYYLLAERFKKLDLFH